MQEVSWKNLSTVHRTDNELIFGRSDDESDKTVENNIDTENFDQLENYDVENELENFNPESFLGSPRNDRSPGSHSNICGVYLQVNCQEIFLVLKIKILMLK